MNTKRWPTNMICWDLGWIFWHWNINIFQDQSFSTHTKYNVIEIHTTWFFLTHSKVRESFAAKKNRNSSMHVTGYFVYSSDHRKPQTYLKVDIRGLYEVNFFSYNYKDFITVYVTNYIMKNIRRIIILISMFQNTVSFIYRRDATRILLIRKSITPLYSWFPQSLFDPKWIFIYEMSLMISEWK